MNSDEWFIYRRSFEFQTIVYADNIKRGIRISIHEGQPSYLMLTNNGRMTQPPLVGFDSATKWYMNQQITKDELMALFQNNFPHLIDLIIESAKPSDSITQKCECCHTAFRSKQPAKYCSPKCRAKAFRHKKNVTPDVV